MTKIWKSKNWQRHSAWQQAAFVCGIWTLVVFLPLLKNLLGYWIDNQPFEGKDFVGGILLSWGLGLFFATFFLIAIHYFKWKGIRFIILNIIIAAFVMILYEALKKEKTFEITIQGNDGQPAPGFFYTTKPYFGEGIYINSVYNLLLMQIMIAGLVYAIHYFLLSKKQEIEQAQLEKQLVTARLSLLSNQMEPHFLFNTFNTIAALIDIAPSRAQETLEDLGHLLRIKLEQHQQQFIPLYQEIDFVKKYLKIEQTRLQERLDVQIQMKPEVAMAKVPNFLLQPLVENAIRHGISQKKSGGTLEIIAQKQEQSLVIIIKDNGIGIQSSRKGVGLQNTTERLQTLYPNQHQFLVENLQEGGVQITIALPFELMVGDLVIQHKEANHYANSSLNR